MNDEEILSAARKKADNTVGEYELSEERKSVIIASAVGVLLCTLMIVVELIVFRRLECGKPALLLTVYSTMELQEGIKRRKKKSLIAGLIMGIIGVVFLLCYIGALIK